MLDQCDFSREFEGDNPPGPLSAILRELLEWKSSSSTVKQLRFRTRQRLALATYGQGQTWTSSFITTSTVQHNYAHSCAFFVLVRACRSQRWISLSNCFITVKNRILHDVFMSIQLHTYPGRVNELDS